MVPKGFFEGVLRRGSPKGFSEGVLREGSPKGFSEGSPFFLRISLLRFPGGTEGFLFFRRFSLRRFPGGAQSGVMTCFSSAGGAQSGCGCGGEAF